MKRLSLFFVAAFMAVIAPLSMTAPAKAISGSDWRAGRIIDDSIFYNKDAMTVDQVQQFLNSKVPVCDTWGTKPSEFGGGTRAQYGQSVGRPAPFICVKDYWQNPATGEDNFGDGVIPAGARSAAQIIWDEAQNYGINPQVILTTIHKEAPNALLLDDWPMQVQYKTAMGYGCPDSTPGVCNSSYYGFYNQVKNAARQFRLYANNPNAYNHVPGRNNYVAYNPNGGCGGTQVFIENQATASLYNYTPYQPNQAALNNLNGSGDGCSAHGNRNFWVIFNNWFGSSITSYCFFGPPGTAAVEVNFRKYIHWLDQGNVIGYSGTGTNCVESHTWNIGLTSWAANVATNQAALSPANARVTYGDITGDGIDEPILIALSPTGSGKVEFHVWNREMNRWNQHIVSNLPATDLANGKIMFADVDGNGKDEGILVLMANTGSGKIEFHVWNPDFKSWSAQTPSHTPVFPMADSTVAFADLDSNGADEPVLILYRNSGSGKVEFHTFNADWRSWRFNTASNLGPIDPTNGFITFADVDGNRVDEAVLISLKGTGSGRIEFHTWNQGVTSWRYHTATNVNDLD